MEDILEVCPALQNLNYHCDRLTHTEVMTYLGEQYLGQLQRGEYNLLWISTPADWSVRVPGRRQQPHWQRIQL